MKKTLVFLFFWFLAQPGVARDWHITASTTALYANINDSRYSYVDEYQILKQPQKFTKNISLGVALTPFENKNFSINFSTNRLTNWQIHRKLHDAQYKVDYDYRTQTILDSVNLGYRFGKAIPQITIANVKLNKKIYFKNNLIAKDSESTIIFGAGIGYMLTKNFMLSSIILAPNKALHAEGGVGMTGTLFF